MERKALAHSFARGFRPVSIAVALTALVFSATPLQLALASPGIIYVKADAAGADNGTSWEDAYTDLQAALAAAHSSDEIWVAAGIYNPTASTDRTASFQLKEGVGLYAGFAGWETARDQRDWEANTTILSGDIGAHGENSDNSYHVVIGSTFDDTTVLDGFTVTGGNADGDWQLGQHRGGGMYSDLFSSPTLANCIFAGNSAEYGGGMANRVYSSPTLTNCTFADNFAIEGGGGMSNNASSPVLSSCTFIGNSATGGGGMYNSEDSSPTLMNCAFSDNSARYGGGVYNGHSNSRLVNCTFSGNAADTSGGGVHNATSDPILANCTFSDNSAVERGGGMSNVISNPVLRNTVMANSAAGGDCYGNVTSEGYNLDSDGTCGFTAEGDLPNTDPLLGPLQDNGGQTFTHALLAGSPAIDGGNPGGCTDPWGDPLVTDQRGSPRPMDGDCNDISICDIGAYEAIPICELPITLWLPMILKAAY